VRLEVLGKRLAISIISPWFVVHFHSDLKVPLFESDCKQTMLFAKKKL
jgi:hypothetical protein